MSTLTVAARFRGPDDSGNGGWVSGALAARLPAGVPVEVTLRRPPPLDRPLPVEVSAGGVRLLDDAVADAREAAVVGEARVVEDDLPTLGVVSAADARAAEAGYHGHREHPFPGCYACGPDREVGDGLRIFPGPVAGLPDDNVAATWRPAADVDLPQVWAALDCPGGWAAGRLGLADRPMVLGRMTAVVETVPESGVELVVVGTVLAREGRRTMTATTLRRTDGTVLGRAKHTWITLR